MSDQKDPVPIVLFAYARPDHLRQTIACLRADNVPLIYAFSDGPRTLDKQPAVTEVRQILRAIDWCEVILVERDDNWGLGRSILAGVGEVLSARSKVIVVEDDLIFVPGMYRYLCAALDRYEAESSVMSVTGWNHPSVIPGNVSDQPYFDGRAECWVWGTWARAWQGMDQDAMSLLRQCNVRGIDVYRYGADLPAMAEIEVQKNIWAVRFLYLHILRGGLCLRPPHSMVEHVGFDSLATNASDGRRWANPPLRVCPPIPVVWQPPVENAECPALWQSAFGRGPSRPVRWRRRAVKVARRAVSEALRRMKGLSREQ